MLAELADQTLAQRKAELERTAFEAKEELRRAIEELEAARTINWELMQRANHLDDQVPTEAPLALVGGPTGSVPCGMMRSWDCRPRSPRSS